ncbi:MAG TPA: LysM peptidoglycan-binding domain-containing protein [Polyangiaceae bacterium]|nr:LysM peptidoglycan-binding domain-containing protein [Polyangiaceae bacterium]
MSGIRPPRALGALVTLGALLLAPRDGLAFVHVAKPGDTLASVAERVYGRIQYERLLVAANELDVQGGLSLVPGMRLEIPAVSYRRITKGDTWAAIAAELLGSPKRADVLAIANGTNPWLPTEDGAEIVVPYNLRLIVTSPDTLPQVAYRYLGDAKKAWMLEQYNQLKGIELRRGDVILVPLTDLPLTEEGKKEARAAAIAEATESRGETRAGQRKVASELPALLADVRGGRYVEAVRRGTGFLSATDLTTPELAVIHRQLLEAYVALSAAGLASAECDAWRKADPSASLDPNWVSPKIIAACRRPEP